MPPSTVDEYGFCGNEKVVRTCWLAVDVWFWFTVAMLSVGSLVGWLR